MDRGPVAVGPSSGCGPTCCRSAATRGRAATGDSPGRTSDLTCREWFAGRGGAARARPRRRPQRQPVGLVGRPGRRRPRRRHRQPPRLGAGRRCVRRSARRRVARSPRSTCCARRGWSPARPLGVVAFTDEEGARFGIACTGSRLLTGVLDPDRARGLTDADGTTLARGDARAPGLDPSSLGRGRRDVAPGRDLRRAARRAGPRPGRPDARSASPPASGRTAGGGSTSTGEANHAGTTRLEDRDDPMLRLAAAVLAAREAATEHDAVATIGRVAVVPNGTNAVPSSVSGPGSTPGDAAETGGPRRRCRGGGRRRASSRSRSPGRPRSASRPNCATGSTRPTRRRTRAADRRRARRRHPGRRGRPSRRCCSCATPPGSATPPPSTPSWTTATPGSRHWPPCWPTSRREPAG